jgi:iron complex transport system ATP-binding protein
VSDVVVLERVSLDRGGQPILRDIDWTVRDGERWAVLGPNGAGKTTLLEVASLYLFPSSGRVTVLGAVHGGTDIRPLRGRIGYASAALARLLHPDASALVAVATGRTGVIDPYWAAPGEADIARARELLDLVGCAALAGHELGTLSEGERQRVQIARALMASPDLLVLDEPAAGLDLGARELLVRSLSGLAADPRVRAILFVTHHVEEIPTGFSHVLLLRGGRVVGAGPIAATLTGDGLTACFGLPLAVTARDGRWAAVASGPSATDGASLATSGPAEPHAVGDRLTSPGYDLDSAAGRLPAPVGEPDPGGELRHPSEPEAGLVGAGGGRGGLVRDPDGRMKAFRPLPPADRLAALSRALRAYAEGDFFDAHEILEPAWMGTDDQAERALYQGLIKLAAAGVHAVRGNPEGARRNLLGSDARLARVPDTAAGALGDALAMVDLRTARAWARAALAALDAAPGDGGRAVARLLALGPAPVRRVG